MADSESRSESSTSASDFSDFEEAMGGNVPVNEGERFSTMAFQASREGCRNARKRGRCRTSTPPM